MKQQRPRWSGPHRWEAGARLQFVCCEGVRHADVGSDEGALEEGRAGREACEAAPVPCGVDGGWVELGRFGTYLSGIEREHDRLIELREEVDLAMGRRVPTVMEFAGAVIHENGKITMSCRGSARRRRPGAARAPSGECARA